MDGLFNKLYWSSTWNETNIGSSFTLPWPQRCPALHILDADIERCPPANTSETQGLPHSLQKQQAGRAGWVSAPGMMLWWWWAELKDKCHTSSPLKRDNCETGSPPSPQGPRRCLFISMPFLGFLPSPSHCLHSNLSGWLLKKPNLIQHQKSKPGT